MNLSGQKLPLRPLTSDLSLPTVLHSVLDTTQKHHVTTVTARTWGPETVRRTKYRTEKTKRLKTKALKKKTLLEPNFLGYRRYPEGRFFLGGVRRYPLRIFFLLRFQTSPSLIARGFRRHLQKSCSPVRSIQKSVFFTGQKREKKTKPEIFPFLSKFHCFFRQIFLMHTCRNWFNAMTTS